MQPDEHNRAVDLLRSLARSYAVAGEIMGRIDELQGHLSSQSIEEIRSGLDVIRSETAEVIVGLVGSLGRVGNEAP